MAVFMKMIRSMSKPRQKDADVNSYLFWLLLSLTKHSKLVPEIIALYSRLIVQN